MSLNSFVTRGGERDRPGAGRAGARLRHRADGGDEPGPAQARQRYHSQLIVLGDAVTETDAAGYWTGGRQGRLLDVVVGAYKDLAARFDMVICEGAGSPAEINLRDSDIVNMGFARAAGVPAVLVGDIDRGGVFASFVGTLAVLDPADQALIAGFLVNKFRGDVSLLKPGLEMLEQLTGRPTLGVLPFADGHRGRCRGRDRLGAAALGRPAARYRRAARDSRRAAADEQSHRRRRARVRAWRRRALRAAGSRARGRGPGRAAGHPGDGRRSGLDPRARHRRGRDRGTQHAACRCSASAAATRCSAP